MSELDKGHDPQVDIELRSQQAASKTEQSSPEFFAPADEAEPLDEPLGDSLALEEEEDLSSVAIAAIVGLYF